MVFFFSSIDRIRWIQAALEQTWTAPKPHSEKTVRRGTPKSGRLVPVAGCLLRAHCHLLCTARAHMRTHVCDHLIPARSGIDSSTRTKCSIDSCTRAHCGPCTRRSTFLHTNASTLAQASLAAPAGDSCTRTHWFLNVHTLIPRCAHEMISACEHIDSCALQAAAAARSGGGDQAMEDVAAVLSNDPEVHAHV